MFFPSIVSVACDISTCDMFMKALALLKIRIPVHTCTYVFLAETNCFGLMVFAILV